MATASPTPFPSSYGGNGRVSRQSSLRHLPRAQVARPVPRRASPLSVLGHSHGFSADAPMIQRIDIGDSSDDEIPQPMKFSALTKALLEAEPSSPVKEDHARGETPSRAPHLKISRKSPPGSSTMRRTVSVSASYVRRDRSNSRDAHSHSHETPAPAPRAASGPAPGGIPSGSIRVKRVPVGTGTFIRGAPVRKSRRTPQGEDEENQPPPMMLKPAELLKTEGSQDPPVAELEGEKPVPLAPMSVNAPHRPAPPPPPKMTVLETATASAGASTTKSKRKRHMTVNGKQFTLMKKIGAGGSSEVYRVMAENYLVFALKKVKLENIDESAVRGYKGEIELLRKLENVDRVVRLYDWEVNEEKQNLSVLMEIGESDLNCILRARLQAEDAKLDLTFTRYYWKEMLECVAAVHAYDIVHSDLKPANFLLVSGRLKLIDFGIANAIDIDNTVNVHRDSHVGTPNYMSPESIQDTNAQTPGKSASPTNGTDQRPREKMMKLGKPSDVWSLGCILYQMVYGRPPFAHIVSQIQRIMAITNPSVVIEFGSHGVGGVAVPPALRATLKKCLNRDPARRPTVEQLLDEGEAWLHPDAGPDLRISKEILGQVIQRVAERFRDPRKPPPTDEEIRQYPTSFYEKIRELLESG